jgi:hypothetical protein
MERPRLTIRPVPSTRPTFAGEMKFTLISRVGANSPGPRVKANVGDSVSSSMAASMPPWMKPHWIHEVRASLHFDLQYLRGGIELQVFPAKQLADRSFRKFSVQNLREETFLGQVFPPEFMRRVAYQLGSIDQPASVAGSLRGSTSRERYELPRRACLLHP